MENIPALLTDGLSVTEIKGCQNRTFQDLSVEKRQKIFFHVNGKIQKSKVFS